MRVHGEGCHSGSSQQGHQPGARIPGQLWDGAAFSQKFGAHLEEYPKGVKKTGEDKLVGYSTMLG